MNFLVHYGVKGQKWGVKNGPPYPIVKSSNGSREASNDIYKTLNSKEKNLVGATKTKPLKELIKPGEEKYILKQILIKEGNTPVTALDIWNTGDREGAISIMTRSGYRGKGYANKSVEEAIDWFSDNRDIDKMVWRTRVDNISSRKLAEKFGFSNMGEMNNWVTYEMTR